MREKKKKDSFEIPSIMSEDQKSSVSIPENPQIRQNLVTTAVNFLLNPTVIDKLDTHKSAFLRKKGLTEAEIALAFEKAESHPNYKQIRDNSRISNNAPVLPPHPPPVPTYQPVPFWWQLSRFSSSLIVLGVAIFGAHYVYKKYIEPWIFGVDNQKKSLEQQLYDMAKSLSQLENHVASLEETVSHQKAQMDKFIQNEVNEYYPTPLALRELKTEIASVKSLLLSRHQFPALPKVVPTIPQWQMPTVENEVGAVKENGVEDKQDFSNKEDDSFSELREDSELSKSDLSTVDSILTDGAVVNENVPEEPSFVV